MHASLGSGCSWPAASGIQGRCMAPESRGGSGGARVATGGAFYRARDASLPDYALTVQRAWTLFSSEGRSSFEI